MSFLQPNLESTCTPLNILAIDDDAGARRSLAIVLKLDGHHSVIAQDAEEAIKLIENTPVPFDLIITDHSMPGLSGVHFVQKLREKAYAGEIFVLSANVDIVAEQEYRKMGIAGIMAKPFDVTDLRGWTKCIQHCREYLSAGEKRKCLPNSKSFCWLNSD